MIDEVEPTSSSEEVEDDPMNLEIWWEDIEETNYEGGEFDSDEDEYFTSQEDLGEDIESDVDNDGEEYFMSQEDLGEDMESDADSDGEEYFTSQEDLGEDIESDAENDKMRR